ncbi:hypothetical protein K2173_026987 [Erythroxylum novogranatense]|uniref:Uncharacterized protein n=1 Tax=Erythroxylum novogranatense TaxID=1862640 RepID=A0AAV8U163_9ROSI|nr:hypothetical protein K2173_026987 [Erythroxylum novogranatense]
MRKREEEAQATPQLSYSVAITGGPATDIPGEHHDWPAEEIIKMEEDSESHNTGDDRTGTIQGGANWGSNGQPTSTGTTNITLLQQLRALGSGAEEIAPAFAMITDVESGSHAVHASPGT